MRPLLAIIALLFALPAFADEADDLQKKNDNISIRARGNIEAFHQAILKGDKQAAAFHLCYPVNVAYGKKTVQLASANMFRQQYDTIFPKQFVEATAKHDWKPQWHSKGLVLINGVFWADEDGCIKSICSSEQCQAMAENFKDK